MDPELVSTGLILVGAGVGTLSEATGALPRSAAQLGSENTPRKAIATKRAKL